MSFPRYPAYKPSGVEWLGEVPEHWEAAPIKRFGLLKGGAGFPHENQGQEDEELSFHKVNALGKADHRGVLPPSENTITRETAKKLGAFVFPPSAIVFAKVGAALLMGRIRVLKRDACIDNNMMGLVVHSEMHDFRFAMYAMQLVHFDLIANPGAVPSLNEGQIGNFKLAVPPVEDQSYIATFLDHETAKIDALIAEQQRLIELLQEKRQAVISHAVTKGLNPDVPMKDSGVEWLGEVPEHWKVRKLSQLCDGIGSGTTPKSDVPEFYEEEGIPWIVTGDLKDCLLETCSNHITVKAMAEHSALKLYDIGSVVVAMYGATIGKAAILGMRATVNQACCVLPPSDQVLGGFLLLFVLAARVHLISLATGGGQPNINQEVVRSLRIPLPPVADQQEIIQRVGASLETLDSVASFAALQVEILQERRSALISAAVTGQIDVRGLVPEAVAA